MSEDNYASYAGHRHNYLDGRDLPRHFDNRDPSISYFEDAYNKERERRKHVELELAELKDKQQQTGIQSPENSIAEVKKLSTRRKLIIHNNFKQHGEKTKVST